MDINEISIKANRMADEHMQQTGCTKEERDRYYQAVFEGLVAKNKSESSVADSMIEAPVKGNMLTD